MPGSTYYTIPANIIAGIKKFLLAKATHILGQLQSIETGLALLPDPEPDATHPGFTEVYTIQDPALPAHPATKSYVDTQIGAATLTPTLTQMFFLGSS